MSSCEQKELCGGLYCAGLCLALFALVLLSRGEHLLRDLWKGKETIADGLAVFAERQEQQMQEDTH